MRLLELTFFVDMRQKNDIESFARIAVCKVSSMCRTRQFLSLESALHIYNFPVRPCIEFCCDIVTSTSAMYLEI